ncbi:MAG: Rha family transcriptional regulator [Methylococcaceae bacterium]|nr:Rha family transcriptional regulator [Methylococcaceae bacterium]
MDLVIINSKKEAVTSHIIIAEGMAVTQDAALKLISKYKNELQEFGKVRFQIVPLESGQKQKQFMLNEHQATLLITLMRNNPETVAFKVKLVKQFAKMESWIKDRMQSSLEYKVMTAIIKGSREIAGKDTTNGHYMCEANLVNWAINGKFKSIDRDSLILDDINLLNDLQTHNAVLIGAGMPYDSRKKSLKLKAELMRSNLLETA